MKTTIEVLTVLTVLAVSAAGCGLGSDADPIQVIPPAGALNERAGEAGDHESPSSGEMNEGGRSADASPVLATMKEEQAEGLVLKNVLDGSPITLNDYAGQVLLINFWATWCPPCRHEIPDLIRLQSDYGSQGFQIIGISIEPGNESGVAGFVRNNGINYPVAITTDEAEEMFGSPRAVPTTYIVNRNGTVVETIVGGRSYSAFASAITPHL